MKTDRFKKKGMTTLDPYIALIGEYNGEVEEMTRRAIQLAPDYFWTAPASHTKYHPKWARARGGLVRHTALTMYLAYTLCDTFECSDYDRAIILAAACLHDSVKFGFEEEDGKKYGKYHPFFPRHYFQELEELYGHHFNEVMCIVERHMGNLKSGAWTPGFGKPQNVPEIVVHLADYVASREKIYFADFIHRDCRK